MLVKISANIYRKKRNRLLKLSQKIEDLFDGTLGLRKIDPADLELKKAE